MKNSIKILLLFISIILGSCTDLDETPVGILAPEGFFKSATDVEAAIYGAYGRMASDQAWGGETQQPLMLLSDMVSTGASWTASQNYEINDFTLTSTHYYSSVMWTRLYNIIGAANIAIGGAKSIDDEEQTKLTLEAEARVIRAYIYYVTVRLFGDIPYLEEAVTEPGKISTIPETSEETVYENIISDLEFGMEHLPMQYDNNVRTRATAGTAATILASVYLTLENWQNAYDYAKWVIDNKDELGYALVSDFQDLFKADLQDGMSEHIFAVDFLGGKRDSDNDDTIPPLTGNNITGGWSIIIPAMRVFSTWDARDYRRKVSLADTIVSDGVAYPYTEFDVQRPYIAKYWRYPGTGALGGGRRSNNNYVLFRYAEVLLIAAESLNEISGPTKEAKGYVDQVRERARRWPTYESDYPANIDISISSKEEFRDLVIEERRLEFAFEYKRWFDIKRRKLGDEVFKGENSIEPHPNFDSSKHYLQPIPQTELDINPNLTQNPGYE